MSSRWPSYQELSERVELLSAALVGGHIQKVRDPDARSVTLKIRVPGQTIFLTLSGDQEQGRLEVSLTQPPTLPQPTGVGRWVRAHLIGQRVNEIKIAPNDRVVTLATPKGGICLELLPHAPNLYTLASDGRVMGWSKRIPSRELRLGKLWTPPARPEHLILGDQDRARQSGEAEEVPSEGNGGGVDAQESTLNPPTALTRDEAMERLLAQLGSAWTPEPDEARDDRDEARECRRLLKQTRARIERLCAALWSDLERADHAQRWREEGELLKSQLSTLKRGMTEVRVTDWYDPELGERTIQLDPKLDGTENVERLFQKHRKALRGAEIASERLEVAEAQRGALVEVAERYAEGPLDELRAELVELGIYKAKQRRRAQHKSQERLPYRVFWSASGEKIWLGRGGHDNHRTSFQAARGQDLWVHTRDVPGAHVIIPLPKRGHTPQHETVLDAAALAVHHSKQRSEDGVALYFTERKHIRPIPGGPPGKVMVAASKTLIAVEVEERITRLYAEAERREALEESTR